MERLHISKTRARALQESINFLDDIIIPENTEYYIVDDDKVELVEETKLLQELCLLNKRRNEILNKLTE